MSSSIASTAAGVLREGRQRGDVQRRTDTKITRAVGAGAHGGAPHERLVADGRAPHRVVVGGVQTSRVDLALVDEHHQVLPDGDDAGRRRPTGPAARTFSDRHARTPWSRPITSGAIGVPFCQ